MSPSSQYATPRRNRRVSVDLPVVVRGVARSVEGACVDISAGGAGLELASLPAVGEAVQIEIHLPSGDVLRVNGEVVHAGQAGAQRCGLRFGSLDARALITLHTLVANEPPT